MSEEKKNLIRDVTARIDKLPEDKKQIGRASCRERV